MLVSPPVAEMSGAAFAAALVTVISLTALATVVGTLTISLPFTSAMLVTLPVASLILPLT
jgi:hypothetical protein